MGCTCFRGRDLKTQRLLSAGSDVKSVKSLRIQLPAMTLMILVGKVAASLIALAIAVVFFTTRHLICFIQGVSKNGVGLAEYGWSNKKRLGSTRLQLGKTNHG